MAEMEQALILDPPSELHFNAPSTEITTSHINLTNPTDKEICFKVKTTAPKTYCVRPNGGTIQPKKSVKVAVMLQPFDVENTDKTRHKFMVQSIFAPEGEYNFESLWRDTPKENFMNSKLKCVFDLAPEAVQPAEDVEQKSPVKAEAKSALVPESTPKIPQSDAETIQKLENTHERLQNELSELRLQNSLLKEEGLRSRVAYDSRGTSAKPADTELHQKPAKQQLELSRSYLLICIVVFLFGLYLGKSIF